MNPIVGIGEVLWDVYPDGRKVAGGAPFNFAFHCRQLGHPAVIVSRVGDDALGRELRDRVRALGLSDEYIQTDHEHPTGTVQVTLDANKVPTYTITENVAWDYLELENGLSVLAEFASAACFGSLAQRNQRSAETICSFMGWVPSCRVFDVNWRPTAHPIKLLAAGNRAKVIKFNAEEFEQTLGAERGEITPTEEFWRHCNTLSKLVIITRGEQGCEVYEEYPYGKHFSEPGVPARVVDTVGAGDAFTAAMVCLHLEGKPLRDCARFANHYAARVCEHQGATPRIDRAEVELQAFGK